MLLITFVENAFKHGMQGEVAGAFVNISLQVKGEKLSLQVENNRRNSGKDQFIQSKGIGLENTRKRLEILYPGKYQWQQNETDTTYFVRLILDLNSNESPVPDRR